MKVAQLCPTLYDPMECIVYGILQARTLEWVAFHFSRGSPQPRDRAEPPGYQLSHQGSPPVRGQLNLGSKV